MDLRGRLIAISREVLKSNKASSVFLKTSEKKSEKPAIQLRKRCRGCEAIRNFSFGKYN